MQKDNSTFKQKAALRRSLLKEIDMPVVMETHGGVGKLFQACYSEVAAGVVFEKNPVKASLLAKQRRTWSVYECDPEVAIAAGAGGHLAVNFLDVDPYGECWKVLDAFFRSNRPRVSKLAIAVNCGLRNKLKLGGAWATDSMRDTVQKRGNNLYPYYLEICEELLKKKAADASYQVSRFNGYYCGHQGAMTHYAALLTRTGGES